MTNEQLPDGLQLAIDAVELHCLRPSAIVNAIRAEHHQRVTLQRHAADQAQRIADLEAERDEVEEDRDELRNERDKHIARIAQLETKVGTLKRLHDVAVDERDKAHGELIIQASDLRAALAERDELAHGHRSQHDADSAELRRVCADRDAARKERDELRAKLAEIKGQEPVAWEVTFHATRHRKELSVLSRLEHGRDAAPRDYAVTGSYSAKPLYARPVPALPDGQQTHTSYRQDYPVREDVLGREIELARADEKLFGVGFLVNGWHVPARLVSAFRPVPTIPDGWRPIETAPKDGSNILVSSAGEMADVSYYQNGYWRSLGIDSEENEHYIYGYLTHWMQIPTAPEAAK